ncbi:ABC transporter ATP-binding protein [Alkalihalobacillus pseudalcaliphilus]|uniref:ABC transporter ATP-binding protein n=1 Tax=Alkalihalobacillus pseudalcaliphilus TaxID=79884 RepID=UPI00064DBB6C|nr:ABC transporter ATP-binding protein [Alkalihalobacillus pseudalcaliphilus]KMK74963.1 peptide ABC transporter substrate-binding protein [Alkalihalobacillus pseudalcaliphilus]
MSTTPLIEVKHLKKYFQEGKGLLKKKSHIVKAVDDVSFTINRGETFGLVGESGSGKSTIGRSILKLHDITSGEILYKGQNLHELRKDQMRGLRPHLQFVFQDPYSSLNPRIRVGDAIGEALLDHGIATKKEIRQKVIEVMELCGLSEYQIDRYPHEFSGGQRQRIGIARSMILNPDFIVADEPVSALDVSIQAQIINLFKKLQEEQEVTLLFISHDLSVVEHLCSKIGVLYLGSMMELGSRDHIYQNPLHPYTKALLSAVPIPDPLLRRERILLKGDIPDPSNPPSGCKFHTRCPFATEQCRIEVPQFREVEPNHYVACHLV